MHTTNLKQLFIRYFAENRNKDLFSFGVIFVLSIFFNYFGDGDFVFTILSLLILIFAGSIFNKMNMANFSIHYLTIPASPVEKLTVQSILAILYYPIIGYSVYFLGSLIGELLGAETFSWSNFINSATIWPEIPGFLWMFFGLSLLMFGSIYFKKNSILLTFLVIAGLGMALMIIDGSIFYIFAKNRELTNVNFEFGYQLNSDAVTFITMGVLPILGTVYFWVLSLIRLKETEV